MARTSRRFFTATVKRPADKDDDWGGLKPGETPVFTGYAFNYWNVTPFDREALVSRYGLESDAVIYFGEGGWDARIANLDILDVDASTRFQIIGTEPQRSNRETPDALSMVLQRAGARPT